MTAVLGKRTETFFDSFRRLEPSHGGGRVRISSVLGSVDQPLIDSTGGRNSPFEGAYITGWYPDAGDARWDTMRNVIREHAFGDNRIDPDDTGVQTTWIAYTVLKEIVKAVDSPGSPPGSSPPPSTGAPRPTPAASPRCCTGASRTCWARPPIRGSSIPG